MIRVLTARRAQNVNVVRGRFTVVQHGSDEGWCLYGLLRNFRFTYSTVCIVRSNKLLLFVFIHFQTYRMI